MTDRTNDDVQAYADFLLAMGILIARAVEDGLLTQEASPEIAGAIARTSTDKRTAMAGNHLMFQMVTTRVYDVVLMKQEAQ
jgi:hypothetical protein